MPGDLPAGYRREAFSSLPSTNTAAFQCAKADAASGLWITAAEQTAGRGRRGRAWHGGPGNLAASLLLIDPAPPAIVATVSFAAGVALHQAVIDLTGPAAAERLKLKWPNDLLLDRLKVAGIAVEGDKLVSGKLAVVIGIGVNCRSHPDGGTVHPAFPSRRRACFNAWPCAWPRSSPAGLAAVISRQRAAPGWRVRSVSASRSASTSPPGRSTAASTPSTRKAASSSPATTARAS
jgi:hypothetical protein